MKQSVIDPTFCTVYCCLKQCSQCNNYDGCAAKPNYPVPAIYGGPDNPAYWIIGWLSWEQAKEYVSLRNKQG